MGIVDIQDGPQEHHSSIDRYIVPTAHPYRAHRHAINNHEDGIDFFSLSNLANTDAETEIWDDGLQGIQDECDA